MIAPWPNFSAAVRDTIQQVRDLRLEGKVPAAIVMSDDARCWLFQQDEYAHYVASRPPTGRFCGLEIVCDDRQSTPRVAAAKENTND